MLGLRNQPSTTRWGERWPSWLSIIAAALGATRFRTLPLLDNRFHQDEALYATYARLIAAGPGHGILN